jgi:hypothetical protein
VENRFVRDAIRPPVIAGRVPAMTPDSGRGGGARITSGHDEGGGIPSPTPSPDANGAIGIRIIRGRTIVLSETPSVLSSSPGVSRRSPRTPAVVGVPGSSPGMMGEYAFLSPRPYPDAYGGVAPALEMARRDHCRAVSPTRVWGGLFFPNVGVSNLYYATYYPIWLSDRAVDTIGKAMRGMRQ